MITVSSGGTGSTRQTSLLGFSSFVYTLSSKYFHSHWLIAELNCKEIVLMFQGNFQTSSVFKNGFKKTLFYR